MFSAFGKDQLPKAYDFINQAAIDGTRYWCERIIEGIREGKIADQYDCARCVYLFELWMSHFEGSLEYDLEDCSLDARDNWQLDEFLGIYTHMRDVPTEDEAEEQESLIADASEFEFVVIAA